MEGVYSRRASDCVLSSRLIVALVALASRGGSVSVAAVWALGWISVGGNPPDPTLVGVLVDVCRGREAEHDPVRFAGWSRAAPPGNRLVPLLLDVTGVPSAVRLTRPYSMCSDITSDATAARALHSDCIPDPLSLLC